jgi:endonuclease G
MAPNESIAIEYGASGQHETFKMSNIAPQTPSFNRGIWKHFETAESTYWTTDREELWVTVGAIVSDSTRAIRKDGESVAIPSAFFRIYVDEENGELTPLAFTVQQDDNARPVELHTIREIEQVTHLDFNPDLPQPAQDYLEQLKAPRIWRTHKR